jgi:hypothetical protein
LWGNPCWFESSHPHKEEVKMKELKEIAQTIVFDLSPLDFSMKKVKDGWIICHPFANYNESYLIEGVGEKTPGGVWQNKFKNAKIGTFEEMLEIAQKLHAFNRTCDVC